MLYSLAPTVVSEAGLSISQKKLGSYCLDANRKCLSKMRTTFALVKSHQLIDIFLIKKVQEMLSTALQLLIWLSMVGVKNVRRNIK